ncbi:hypothetical protein GCM10010992_20320 [Cloacibacterium rupense]|uniref:Mechanosensitive ion channel n=1 Tax=Cloacibacterium rupense TaxID=517423 RepID=A0ABQ2NL23_9FLAO|nr:mechanosensitive ion channel domain-containing protein [Cloacibacterium rupense]GGP05174.1 hypothetical protein GCM10010992_20320 [Cloacibacterium rupense]
MKKEFLIFSNQIEQIWLSFIHKIPALIVALLVLAIGVFVIKFTSSRVRKIIQEKARDSIATTFLVNIVSIILTLFLISISLGILGYGNITDKILAGTAITTVIVGFALKDIGENFLAGILMAFRRPFKIGDLIEVQKIRGRVKDLSLRETNIQTLDGKDVFIPNSIILKNPLENYTYHQLLMSDFTISVKMEQDVEKIMADIVAIVNSFNQVEKMPKASALITDFVDNTVKIRCSYWFKTTDVNAPGGGLRSEILKKVLAYLKANNINIPPATA